MAHGYPTVKCPEHPLTNKRGYIYEHRLVAERAVGRYLKEIEVVHHVDGNKKNNLQSNLVICQDDNYHKFLHQRAKQLLARPGIQD